MYWVFNHGATVRGPATAGKRNAGRQYIDCDWRGFVRLGLGGAFATQFGAVWAGAAALIAPVMAVIPQVHAGEVIGSYPWALHIAALALMQVVLAGFARVDVGID